MDSEAILLLPHSRTRLRQCEPLPAPWRSFHRDSGADCQSQRYDHRSVVSTARCRAKTQLAERCVQTTRAVRQQRIAASKASARCRGSHTEYSKLETIIDSSVLNAARMSRCRLCTSSSRVLSDRSSLSTPPTTCPKIISKDTTALHKRLIIELNCYGQGNGGRLVVFTGRERCPEPSGRTRQGRFKHPRISLCA